MLSEIFSISAVAYNGLSITYISMQFYYITNLLKIFYFRNNKTLSKRDTRANCFISYSILLRVSHSKNTFAKESMKHVL